MTSCILIEWWSVPPIAERRSVRKLFVESLVKRGDITVEEAEQALSDYQGKLQIALDETRKRMRLDAHGAVGPHRQSGEQLLVALLPAHCDHDDLGLPLLADPKRLLDRQLVERVDLEGDRGVVQVPVGVDA